ncbi:MAG: helix-turn-helix domain-containing protein [Bdellovibrionota bacterium]
MDKAQKRPKIVGGFIRKRRESQGISQRALGLLFDPPVTTQFISNVERGVTPLPPAHVPTLARAFQIPDTEILALLEREYTQKLSERLGKTDEAVGPGSVAGIPLPPNSKMIPVALGDAEFIRALYDAYSQADPRTRQAFSNACESLLNLSKRS